MDKVKYVPPTMRPMVMGRRFMVSAGHPLAALAATEILEEGGNAFDAGVAGALCLNVVQADLTNIGGVAPVCLFRADTGAVETVSGLGWWPAATDPEVFHRLYGGRIARGIHRSVMPAAIDAWLTVLERHGSMPLARVAHPAIELAAQGFPLHWLMLESFSDTAAVQAMRGWPATRATFLDGAAAPMKVGDLVVQRDLARTLRRLVEASQAADSREAGVRAARQRFYTGDIADEIADFVEAEGGWITREDLADFRVGIEEPVHVSYRGYDVYACGPWCQGPVVPMALRILEGYDIASMGPGSAEVNHVVLEALKAAFADRDRYFADPRYTAVPIDGLLSPDYAAHWRSRISLATAFPGMPEPGDAWRYSATAPTSVSTWRHPDALSGAVEPDTSYLCVVDGDGNGFSATPSDGVTTGPLVPGLGFLLSSRGMQSWLDPTHPSAIAPGRRPRLTPSPGMVLKDGQLVMPFGSPGNDVQPQAMVQFLVNVIDFGMDVQAAVEAPRCATFSFPRSSDPHPYSPGLACIEGRADAEVIESLRRRGHRLETWPAWTGTSGSVSAILRDPGTGTLFGAADPRRLAYALGR